MNQTDRSQRYQYNSVYVGGFVIRDNGGVLTKIRIIDGTASDTRGRTGGIDTQVES